MQDEPAQLKARSICLQSLCLVFAGCTQPLHGVFTSLGLGLRLWCCQAPATLQTGKTPRACWVLVRAKVCVDGEQLLTAFM